MTNFYDILEPGSREAATERRYEEWGLNPPRLLLGWEGGEVGYRKAARPTAMSNCRVCGKAMTLPGYAALGRHPRCWG